MNRSLTAACLLLLGVLSLACGQERLPVQGSEATFPASLTHKLGEREVRYTCTGVALREKVWFNVYAIASYVEEGQKPADAAALAALDAPKLLHLKLERDVSGDDMIGSLKEAVGANHPDAFADELAALGQLFAGQTCKRNHSVRFLHVPGEGLWVEAPGRKEPFKIKGVPFAHAFWEIYLGKKVVSDEIKTGLTARLKAN